MYTAVGSPPYKVRRFAYTVVNPGEKLAREREKLQSRGEKLSRPGEKLSHPGEKLSCPGEKLLCQPFCRLEKLHKSRESR